MMAKISEHKTIQRKRTESDMRQALTDFCTGKQQISIPPQVDDSDIVLSDAIAEVLELRAKVEELRGWMATWLAKDSRK